MTALYNLSIVILELTKESEMQQPWDYARDNASRVVRLRVNDERGASDTDAYCTVASLAGNVITDICECAAERTIYIDSLPIDFPLGTFAHQGSLTLHEHITHAITVAVNTFLATITFKMTATGDSANYWHAENFNFRLECIEYPELEVVHEAPHSDFFLNWRQFVEESDPQYAVIEQMYSDYYAERAAQKSA